MIAATIGAAGIPPARFLAALGFGDGEPAQLARDRLVLWSIRLPRIALTASVGALLAVAGTLMQGLFRNPLADPALVGVSGGGALAAATTIVVGDRLLAGSGMTLAVRGAADRGLPRGAGDHRGALPHGDAGGPHLDCDPAARRARGRGAGERRHRSPRFSWPTIASCAT